LFVFRPGGLDKLGQVDYFFVGVDKFYPLYKFYKHYYTLYQTLHRLKRKIHSILTYQMENNRKGCINRDKNGCKNTHYVFNYYKKTGKRPEKFRREYKLERIASTTETKVEVVKCANA